MDIFLKHEYSAHDHMVDASDFIYNTYIPLYMV